MSGTIQLTVFADHHQFYLEDARVEGDSSELWTHQAFLNMLATGPGIVGVGTARNFHVPVTVCVRDSDPGEEDLGRWDHVAEASLPVPSGCLMVRGCTEPQRNAARIAVEPGLYRVCVYYSNLDSVSANGIEGEDSYKVVLWPSWEEATRVLKRSGWRERNP